MLTLFVVLIAVTAVSCATAWRADSRLHTLQHHLETDRTKLSELEQRVDKLKGNLMKVLTPIRQNSEDIAELDNDLARVQALIDELKKREEKTPPPPALVR